MTKYGNHKLTTPFGVFDSKLEYKRFLFLNDLLNRGIITSLHRQEKFILVPPIYDVKTVQLKTKTKQVKYLAERPVEYRADFVYTNADGQLLIEDTKGFRTKEYIIKRKLMRLNGLVINEVNTAATDINTLIPSCLT